VFLLAGQHIDSRLSCDQDEAMAKTTTTKATPKSARRRTAAAKTTTCITDDPLRFSLFLFFFSEFCFLFRYRSWIEIEVRSDRFGLAPSKFRSRQCQETLHLISPSLSPRECLSLTSREDYVHTSNATYYSDLFCLPIKPKVKRKRYSEEQIKYLRKSCVNYLMSMKNPREGSILSWIYIINS